MKFAYLFAIAVRAQDGGDGGTPHDPEAMAFCQGKVDGFYQDVKDCASYFFCWNGGSYRGPEGLDIGATHWYYHHSCPISNT